MCIRLNARQFKGIYDTYREISREEKIEKTTSSQEVPTPEPVFDFGIEAKVTEDCPDCERDLVAA